MKPLGRGELALDVALDWRALGFSAALALLTGIIFGLLPALRAMRVNLTAEFHGGTRQVGDGPDSRVGRGVLLVQVALSLVLLVGAGLFMRTLENLHAVDAGFNRENLLLFRLGAEPAGYSLTAAGALHARVATQLARLPGVKGATYARMPLLSQAGWNSRIAVPGHTLAKGGIDTAMVNSVGPDFFSVINLPVLAGRSFTNRDEAGAPKVAVINQALTQKYFGTDFPIGRRLGRGRAAAEWKSKSSASCATRITPT